MKWIVLVSLIINSCHQSRQNRQTTRFCMWEQSQRKIRRLRFQVKSSRNFFVVILIKKSLLNRKKLNTNVAKSNKWKRNLSWMNWIVRVSLIINSCHKSCRTCQTTWFCMWEQSQRKIRRLHFQVKYSRKFFVYILIKKSLPNPNRKMLNLMWPIPNKRRKSELDELDRSGFLDH